MPENSLPIQPAASAALTPAARSYRKAVNADLRFFHFLIDTVLAGDYVAFTARRALDGEKLDHEMTPSKLATAQPGPRTLFLRQNSQALLEMFLGRLVDTFQKLLVDLIRDILRRKPEILRTRKESLTVEEVLRFTSVEELVQAIIERKVSSLAYEGFGRVHDWCVEKGIPLEVAPQSLPSVVELIACRNIIAHNRGIVDERYLEAVPTTSLTLGQIRSLSPDDVFTAARLLGEIVQNSDAAASAKYGLATTSEPETTKAEEDANGA